MVPVVSGNGQNMTAEQRSIRVVLADDHELLLKGLRGILKHEPDIDVVGSAMTGRELLFEVRTQRPDVAVIDSQLPDMTGLECLAQIRRENLPTKVLILTAFSDGESFQSALELEADGIALKTEPPAQTVAAIRQVYHGQLVFPRAARRWRGRPRWGRSTRRGRRAAGPRCTSASASTPGRCRSATWAARPGSTTPCSATR